MTCCSISITLGIVVLLTVATTVCSDSDETQSEIVEDEPVERSPRGKRRVLLSFAVLSFWSAQVFFQYYFRCMH